METPKKGSVVALRREDFAHLTDAEWESLNDFQATNGIKLTTDLLRKSHEYQRDVLSQFLLQQSRKIAIPPFQQRTVKLEVSSYRGDENESLPRWFAELDMAFQARCLYDDNLKVAFAMSKLAGRAKAWAYGRRMGDSHAFPSFEDLANELAETFQPPQSEFRMRQRFLRVSQGRRDLHSYAQEVRFLVANIVENPVDMATQVSVFLSGLADGPVRTQMFRKYPTDLDEAIREALQEEFSLRQARRFGYVPTFRNNSRQGTSRNGPEPMDIGSMDVRPDNRTNAPRRPRIGRPLDKSRLTCRRCQRVGHFAAECRASAPVPPEPRQNQPTSLRVAVVEAETSERKNEKGQ